MKRLLGIVSAAALLAAGTASAQVGDDSVVTFGGSVTPQCNISGSGGHIDINTAVSGGLINADGFLNWAHNTTLMLGDLNDYFGEIWCNSAGATIELSLVRLTSSNGPGPNGASNWAGGGFDHEITVRTTALSITPVNATPAGQVMPTLVGGPGSGVPSQAGDTLNPGVDTESRTFTATKWFYGEINGEFGMYNDPTRRPIAGDYTGSLTLTVTPTT